MTILETVTGVMFDCDDPKIHMVNLDDIAWSLSRQSRFNGHTIPVVPYSVAQHCVLVSDDLAVNHNNQDLLLAALLHDSAEAYISDIPSPVKQIPGVREKIKELEDKILKVVFDSFEVPWPSDDEWELIHMADLKCRAIEAHAFMFSRGSKWHGLPEVSLLDLQRFEQPWESITAYNAFKDRFRIYNYGRV